VVNDEDGKRATLDAFLMLRVVTRSLLAPTHRADGDGASRAADPRARLGPTVGRAASGGLLG
jgi:hypothetical protein